MQNQPMLHFVSGKLGSGKTTLAKKLAEQYNMLLISEDIWLEKLFPTEIVNFQNYIHYSKRLRDLLATHVVELLKIKISVIFDFAGNTPEERAWVKAIIDRAKVKHILHYIDVPDEICRIRFKKRNLQLLEGSKIVTDEEFDAINRYFIPPQPQENFNLKFY